MTALRRAFLAAVPRAGRLLHAALGFRATQQEPAQPWSGTFHAIGARLLREYATALGIDVNFSVLDRGDSADLMDLQRQELGLSRKEKRFPRKDTCLAIYSHRVNTRFSGWSGWSS